MHGTQSNVSSAAAQSTSDLDHFHAHDLPCSCVKSRDDPISDCSVDSAVSYSFIYRDKLKRNFVRVPETSPFAVAASPSVAAVNS